MSTYMHTIWLVSRNTGSLVFKEYEPFCTFQCKEDADTCAEELERVGWLTITTTIPYKTEILS